MNKKFSIVMLLGVFALYLTSCYNNKKDIDALPQVSFTKEIVPIVTDGPCGCHNNGASQRAVQWSNLYKQNHGVDTINYDAILARAGVLKTWVNGGSHPGGGGIYFSAAEAKIIKDWINQGALDDRSTGTVTGNVTYSGNIAAMVTSTCNGGACHGGLGPTLTYTLLKADVAKLQSMISTKGASGHPGGVLSLGNDKWALIDAWIKQGMN